MFIFTVQGVMLSPAAKCFIPKSFTVSAEKSSVAQQQLQQCGLLDMSQMPHKGTSGWPFVNYDYAQNLQ